MGLIAAPVSLVGGAEELLYQRSTCERASPSLILPAKLVFISLHEGQTPAILQTEGPGEVKAKHQGCSEVT